MAERRHLLDHLARGLLGERDEEDLVLRHDAGVDRVSGMAADDPGLAGAGAGDDRKRAAYLLA